MSDTPLGISVGDSLPTFTRETGLANWNRFAAVNYEFVDIHMDDEAGRAAGYDSAFGMGNLLWSYLHNMLRQWIGARGEIVSLQCQFRAPNTKGMTILASGSVTEVRAVGDWWEVAADVRIEDHTGSVLTPGQAVVRFAA